MVRRSERGRSVRSRQPFIIAEPNGCDAGATDFDGCTNNVMGRGAGTHSSNLQMGPMHRLLSATQVSKSAAGYKPGPTLSWPILDGAIWAWDFPLKIYRDARVRSGRMLKTTDRARA